MYLFEIISTLTFLMTDMLSSLYNIKKKRKNKFIIMFFSEKIEQMLKEVLRVCQSENLAIHCHDTNGMAIDNIAQSLEVWCSETYFYK